MDEKRNSQFFLKEKNQQNKFDKALSFLLFFYFYLIYEDKHHKKIYFQDLNLSL